MKQVKIIAVPMKAVGRMLLEEKTIRLKTTGLQTYLEGISAMINRHKMLLK